MVSTSSKNPVRKKEYYEQETKNKWFGNISRFFGLKISKDNHAGDSEGEKEKKSGRNKKKGRKTILRSGQRWSFPA